MENIYRFELQCKYMINFALLRMLLISVIGTAPGDKASREITQGMLVSEDEASFLIKEKGKKEKRKGGAVSCWSRRCNSGRAAVLPCSSWPRLAVLCGGVL